MFLVSPFWVENSVAAVKYEIIKTQYSIILRTDFLKINFAQEFIIVII